MKLPGKTFIAFIALLLSFTTACTALTTPAALTTPPITAQSTPTAFQPAVEDPVVEPLKLDVSLLVPPGFPKSWSVSLQNVNGLSIVDDDPNADLFFIPAFEPASETTLFTTSLIFAAVVPFFTVEDTIDPDLLPILWGSKAGDELGGTILVSGATAGILNYLWGESGENVLVTDPSELLTLAEANATAIAIIPFEAITPRWKILKLDGISPLDKPLDVEKYALNVYFHLHQNENSEMDTINIQQQIADLIPASNRDESKMTVLIMSGTTAITRGLAYKVLINDSDYPIAMVKDWFLAADLRHVSNESPFVEDCPYPDPYTSSLVFCTSPKMIEIFEKIGINVVELTGNHINDYGLENLEATMQMYKDRGWAYYAAGVDADAARQPVLLEHNGNRIAFIGCNAVGPNSVWAKDERPGAAECDFNYLDKKIRELKEQGYVVVTTFQHEELTKQDGSPAVLMFAEKISGDFISVTDSGADIVQGSQAHYPMGFEFVGDSLIHYGLGNFLFDQMWEPNRNEFIDRHIIYDGKYINTEVLTAVLMDWSQPTPMEADQRAQFLEEIYQASLKRKK